MRLLVVISSFFGVSRKRILKLKQQLPLFLCNGDDDGLARKTQNQIAEEMPIILKFTSNA